MLVNEKFNIRLAIPMHAVTIIVDNMSSLVTLMIYRLETKLNIDLYVSSMVKYYP